MQAKPSTVLAGSSFMNFLDGIRSKASRQTHEKVLRLYCEFTRMDTDKLIDISSKDLPGATEQVKRYLRHLKERVEVKKDLQPATVGLYFNSVKLFYSMNDIVMNWAKLSKMIPEQTTLEDRAYTKEEIDKMLQLADIREKVIILLLTTAGLRIGALADLQIKHLTPMHSKKDNKLLAGLLMVYANTPDKYFTFITPECYGIIQQYLEYRKRNHEKVEGDAPLIRNKIRQGVPSNSSSRRNPKKLSTSSMVITIWGSLIKSGVREQTDTKRYPVKMDHGFRKFFNTMCKKANVDVMHKEMLMGHSIGLDDSYYRPGIDDLLPDYVKVIPSLTFDDAEVLKVQNMNLQKEIEKEQEKDKRIERHETTIHSLMIHLRELKQSEGMKDKKIEDNKRLIHRLMIDRREKGQEIEKQNARLEKHEILLNGLWKESQKGKKKA